MPSRVNPRLWPWALALYPAVGLLAGSGALHAAAIAQGLKPGVGTMLAINVAMPLAAIAIAAWFPRIWTAAAGAPLMMLAFVAMRMWIGNHDVLAWDFAYLKAMTHPIEVVAVAGYALIGIAAACVAAPFRRFRLPDHHLRCAWCDYLLVGAAGDVCPECGRRR